MPRVVELTVPPERTDEVVRRLRDLDEVLSLRLLRGVSLEPAGDVVGALFGSPATRETGRSGRGAV